MKNRFFYIAGLIFTSALSAFASQPTEVIIKFNLAGKPGLPDTVNALSIGIKAGATDTLDEALGEKEIPPFWPPSGLEARMSIAYPGKTKYSYNDFRGFENSTTFKKVYVMNIASIATRRGDPKEDYKDFYIQWEPLSQYIDSARITDELDVIDINLKNSTQALYTNEFVEKLFITVYYNMEGIPNSVIENSREETSGIKLYPNPAKDELFIGNAAAQYSIISVTGKVMLSGESLPFKAINLSALPTGVYAIKIDSGSESVVKRFVKE